MRRHFIDGLRPLPPAPFWLIGWLDVWLACWLADWLIGGCIRELRGILEVNFEGFLVIFDALGSL